MKRLIYSALFVSALILSAAEPPRADAKADAYLPDALTELPVCRFIPQPTYPFELRRKEITGDATIEFIVDAKGNISEAWVIKATHPEFGEAARKAVLHGKFRPGKLKGKPVRTRMQITEKFWLK